MSGKKGKSVNRVIQGEALEGLGTLEPESVHCVVTSPPYWGLRDYGVEGQLGLEAVHDCSGWAKGETCGECYICRMRAVFAGVRRVLRRDGTCWLNMGDSYRRKQLAGVPWRLALALQADGWYLRADVIWAKPNPMPHSVKDRPATAHEYVFLLTRRVKYYWDWEASREPAAAANEHDATGQGWHAPGQRPQTGTRPKRQHPTALSFARHVNEPERPGQSAKQHRPQRVPAGWDTGPGSHGEEKSGRYAKLVKTSPCVDHELRNMRSVWNIPTRPYNGAHFATFPPQLVERCIKAGCPVGGVVLDPFFGAGTVGVVALKLGRKFVGVELNPEYVRMAEARIHGEAGLMEVGA